MVVFNTGRKYSRRFRSANFALSAREHAAIMQNSGLSLFTLGPPDILILPILKPKVNKCAFYFEDNPFNRIFAA